MRKDSAAIFFKTPIARVRVEYATTDKDTLYSLVDVADGHKWLEFGTENEDDYYPYFSFHYQPKESQASAGSGDE